MQNQEISNCKNSSKAVGPAYASVNRHADDIVTNQHLLQDQLNVDEAEPVESVQRKSFNDRYSIKATGAACFSVIISIAMALGE